MPHITTSLSPLSGDAQTDIALLHETLSNLIKELRFIVNNIEEKESDSE